MSEHGHDRLDAGAAFGELDADGVPEPMRGDRRSPGRVDEPGRCAGGLERQLEQERG